MKLFYVGGNTIVMVNLLWEYKAYTKIREWDDETKSACVACKSTKAWIELRQKLFDMVSWIEYKDCELKGVEQVDGNEINEKEVNMISKTNKKIKQMN
ncbi:27746_t:CDS:2 [Dentiscutata erythropus]|uniref:27746_t:CDS:1 n=1 Tax=Dentiscutata erythropus TaxID=1348616 RepID=A0A9N9HIX3_9GLOM|nr:27746_t:CDS:2 [Dentiscutata erythropus]